MKKIISCHSEESYSLTCEESRENSSTFSTKNKRDSS